MNALIKEKIKERKCVNREWRKEINILKKIEYKEKYEQQKRKAHAMIQETIYTYEKQLTDEIRQDRCKRIWTCINKLREMSSHREEEKVYDEVGSLLQGEGLTRK